MDGLARNPKHGRDGDLREFLGNDNVIALMRAVLLRVFEENMRDSR